MCSQKTGSQTSQDQQKRKDERQGARHCGPPIQFLKYTK